MVQTTDLIIIQFYKFFWKLWIIKIAKNYLVKTINKNSAKAC